MPYSFSRDPGRNRPGRKTYECTTARGHGLKSPELMGCPFESVTRVFVRLANQLLSPTLASIAGIPPRRFVSFDSSSRRY